MSRSKRESINFVSLEINENTVTKNPLYTILTFNTNGANTLNKTVYDALLKERDSYGASFETLEDFVVDELKDPSSTACKIFEEATKERPISTDGVNKYHLPMNPFGKSRNDFMKEVCQKVTFLLFPPWNLLYCLAEGY